MPRTISGYAERKPLAVEGTSAHRSVLRTTLSLIGRRVIINLCLAQVTEAGGDYIRALNPVSPFVWCVYTCLVCAAGKRVLYFGQSARGT